MPLDAEFKKHLHSLMIEVYGQTSDACVQRKNELLGNARVTHNSSAVHIAYKDAALYSTEFRLSRTIEKYIEAVAIWGLAIDAAFERDMISEFRSLTAGPNQFQLPPMMRGAHVQAVQGAYARERQQLAARLVLEGTNRLRELKMKNMQAMRNAAPAVNTIHNNFNGPVGNAFINSSVIQTNNSFTITSQTLNDIDQISVGNSELQAAALEIRNAHIQGTNTVEKFQKWATLALAVAGVVDKVHQYYPHVAALIEQFKLIK